MEPPNLVSAASNQIYTCDDCSLQIEGIANLLSHRKVHNCQSPGQTRIYMTEYYCTCPLCTMDWATRLDEETSSQRRHQPFRYDANLEDLMRSTRGKNRNACIGNVGFQCPNCDRMFTLVYNLKIHFKRMHGKSSQQFICNECSKVFATEQYFKYHSRIHTDRCFRCPHCDKKCGRRKHMHLHMKRIHHKCILVSDCQLCLNVLNPTAVLIDIKHSTEDSNTCPHCNKKFGLAANLKYHIQRMHTGGKYSCDLCSRIFTSKSTFEIHQRIHTDQCYICPHCPKKFTYKSKLRVHIETIHEEIKFPCDQCPKIFASKEYLKYHKTIHTDFCIKCTECDKKFGRPYQLVQHKNRMHKKHVEKLKCDYCPKLFTSKDFLRCHLRSHTGNEFCCPICDKKFIRNFDMNTHIERMHTNPDRTFPCSLCPKTFKNKNNLKEHEILHSTNCFACSECSKKFTTGKKLNMHIKALHRQKEKTMPCDECDEMFDGRVALRIHKRIHRPQLVNCPQCTKVFKEESHLRRHITRNHHDEQYPCSKCPKVFKNKDSLAYHEKYFNHINAQEQLFACSFCEKSFSVENSLKLHEKTHTEYPQCKKCDQHAGNASGKKKCAQHAENAPYKKKCVQSWICDICLKVFKTYENLKTHKILHIDESFICEYCEKKCASFNALDEHMKTHRIQQDIIIKSETIIEDLCDGLTSD